MPDATLSDDELRARIAAVPFWYHRMELRPGIVTPGINDPRDVLAAMDLPERCDGLRVLDVGARDGFFSFELERRGADVLALDYMDPRDTGFPVAAQAHGSGLELQVGNVYDVSPEEHGTFDLVLFLGVLYHLRDPLLALDTLWDATADGGTIVVETQLLDGAVLLRDGALVELESLGSGLAELRLAQFYAGDELRGDPSNYWAPSASCMRGLLRETGFEPVRERLLGSRGVFAARRVTRPESLFHRRLEKSTFSAVTAALAPTEPVAAEVGADAADVERLRREAAAASFRERVAGDELRAAKRHIEGLEAALAAKDAVPAHDPAARRHEPEPQPVSEPRAREAIATAGRATLRAVQRRLGR